MPKYKNNKNLFRKNKKRSKYGRKITLTRNNNSFYKLILRERT